MGEDSKVNSKNKPNKQSAWSGVAFIIGFAAIMLFLYYDRNNVVSGLVQSIGASGVIGAVLIMTIVCVTPIPSEGLLIMNLKIYGVYLGIIYSWLGFILGSLVVYTITRFLGNRVICSWTLADKRINSIDTWISRKGTVGLLFVRLLPIPALLVNMFTAILPSVSFWRYVWTGAVGIIPYYIGVTLIFRGISNKEIWGLFIGIFVLMMIGAIGVWERRK